MSWLIIFGRFPETIVLISTLRIWSSQTETNSLLVWAGISILFWLWGLQRLIPPTVFTNIHVNNPIIIRIITYQHFQYKNSSPPLLVILVNVGSLTSKKEEVLFFPFSQQWTNICPTYLSQCVEHIFKLYIQKVLRFSNEYNESLKASTPIFISALAKDGLLPVRRYYSASCAVPYRPAIL